MQATRRPELLATPPAARPALSVTWVTALFVVALAGRITPDRAGLPDLGVGDLRKTAFAVLAFMAVLWQVELWHRVAARPWPRLLIPFTALIAAQLASALWAPWAARVEQVTWDLLLLWLLVICTAAFTAADPPRAARILLALTLAAGIIYALAGLQAGPQAQGRMSAFGGGPNVFVRVMCLAVIAAITLAVASRRWWLLAPVPVLAVAAVLSGSRGGLIAAVAAATVFFVFFLRRRRTAVLAATLLLGSAAGWAVWEVMGAAVEALAATRYNTTALDANGYSERPELLTAAWDLFRQHPIAGAGMDAFNAATGMNYPHNYLAGLAAETGIVGVGLLMWAVVRWCRDGHPWKTATPEQIGCAVAAVYVLAASMFSGGYYDTRFFWIFAVVAVGRHHPRPHTIPQPKGIPWRGSGGYSSSTTTPNRHRAPEVPATSSYSAG
ncbi:O-antigen ligase family protein [Micromonospora sp. NPDC007271]|uniref:O-antigen ligase family protein n=1 Tax=Micromonospora sp. NPDC007271 TaxID=3154587 RepID=UPI0033C7DF78